MAIGMKAICMTGFSSLDPQFDGFLYAELCEHDETTLSVLSALTRQNIDPWQLAARLAQLPKAQAVTMLASIVEQSDHGRWSPSDANRMAVRLVELLPSKNDFGIAPPSMEPVRAYLMIWVLYGIFWGTLALIASNPQNTGNNYNGSSAVGASVSQQVQSSLQRSTTD
jgi:hypothetical protein